MTKNDRYRVTYAFETRHALPPVMTDDYWAALAQDYESMLQQHDDDNFLREMLSAVMVGLEGNTQRLNAK